jgi:hypothetical protein
LERKVENPSDSILVCTGEPQPVYYQRDDRVFRDNPRRLLPMGQGRKTLLVGDGQHRIDTYHKGNCGKTLLTVRQSEDTPGTPPNL